MNLGMFLKHRYVRLSLLSLLGQMIIISIASVMLFYTDVSLERAIVLVVVLLGFTFIFSVTILRLLNLAKSTGYINSK
jgi:hypothetical protein